MHSTQYLFDKEPSDYPEQKPLAKRKIADAKALLKKLSMQKNYMSTQHEIDVIIERYQAVEDAVKHWTKILNEGVET